MRLEIVEISGDLLDQDVDAIVNAWNRNFIPYWMLIPHGVSRDIKKRAGTKPFREVRKKGLLTLGEAVLTSAGRLPHKAIIHVAGIGILWSSSEKAIRLSVRNAMRIVGEQKFESVAFPLIGCGAGKFDKNMAVEIMMDELKKIHLSYSCRVLIVKYVEHQTTDFCIERKD